MILKQGNKTGDKTVRFSIVKGTGNRRIDVNDRTGNDDTNRDINAKD